MQERGAKLSSFPAGKLSLNFLHNEIKIPSTTPIRPKRKPHVLTNVGGARDPKNTTQMLPKTGINIRREENLGISQPFD